MNIEDLSNRTGLSVRRLRYVIEYEVLPLSEGLNPGRGGAREFSQYTGLCIALAALMLKTGLRRDLVKLVMETVTGFWTPIVRSGPKGIPCFPVFYEPYGVKEVATLEIGDGANVTIKSARTHLKVSETVRRPLSLPWTQMNTGARLASDYTPHISICVRIDLLARLIRLRVCFESEYLA